MTEIVIKASEEFHKVLGNVLALHNPYAAVKFITEQGDQIICEYKGENKIFQIPVRLGKILDFITRATELQNSPKIIHFGNAALDTHSLIFTTEKGKKINLTEKEAGLLIYLHKNKGEIITRENLLKIIWNYADDVETHTLETHIYRLRKKIEKNPSAPTILITADNGYSVS